MRETRSISAKTSHEALGALASRQHGVFSLAQLCDLGLSQTAVNQRVADGRLYVVHRGVFSLAPPQLLSRRGHYMSAVLAAGPGACLSHRSAADLHGLRASDRARTEVIRAGAVSRQRRPTIEFHTSQTLLPVDVTAVDGIPCTTIARTLLDLAAVVRPRVLERTFDQAAVMEVLDAGALQDQLARNPKHRGGKPLRAVLTKHSAGSTATWNDLEERMLSVCRSAGLPDPEVNAWVVCDDGEPAMRVDFLWREQRVIVETDGYGSHRTHRAFEVDRRRDQRLSVAGWRVIRVTWRQLTDNPQQVAGVIAELLARPR